MKVKFPFILAVLSVNMENYFAMGLSAAHSDLKNMDMDQHDHSLKDNMGNMSDHGMSMPMYFHFGVNEHVLFKEWKIENASGMIASVIGIFLLGMLYEGLKYLREHLFKKYLSSLEFSTVAVTGQNSGVSQIHKVQKYNILSWMHSLQTFLHMVQIIISYFLMLIFMTYNVWLCLAVALGAGVGYFVFGWRKATIVDITEHCH